MLGRRGIGLLAIILTIGQAGEAGPGLWAKDRNNKNQTIRIGMIGSLFRNVPEPLVMASMGPFRALMEAQTGLRGQIQPGGDAFTLGEQLHADKLHLGVFHGFEFAWAQKRYPDLRPLMIVVNQQRNLHALIVVRHDCPAKTLADLKGKELAIPAGAREHCLLYLEGCCESWGKEGSARSFKIITPGNVEDALDDLVDGKAQAVLMDKVSLDCYKRRKPGRATDVKILQKSCTFPAAVVAYHAGAVKKATLRRFQVGMMKANKTAFGRQLLTLWKITGFEKVPDDFADILTEVEKVYPAPKSLKVAIKD